MFVWEFIQENRCICYSAINPFKDSHVMRTAGNVNGKPSAPCHNPWGYVCAGWRDCGGNCACNSRAGLFFHLSYLCLDLSLGPWCGTELCELQLGAHTAPVIAPVLRCEQTGLLLSNHSVKRAFRFKYCPALSCITSILLPQEGDRKCDGIQGRMYLVWGDPN